MLPSLRLTTFPFKIAAAMMEREFPAAEEENVRFRF
jgi:hypothetical protein